MQREKTVTELQAWPHLHISSIHFTQLYICNTNNPLTDVRTEKRKISKIQEKYSTCNYKNSKDKKVPLFRSWGAGDSSVFQHFKIHVLGCHKAQILSTLQKVESSSIPLHENSVILISPKTSKQSKCSNASLWYCVRDMLLRI